MRELRQFRDSVVPAQVLELFHGWKIYDYLIYTRYRFLQRETRWKGLEDSLDECIDESVRTLDQMCFSSQYYMMMTVQVSDSASVSELQLCEDGVSTISRHRDAVDVVAREFLDCVVPRRPLGGPGPSPRPRAGRDCGCGS